MKSKYFIAIIAAGLLVSCKKTIDLYPISNLNTGTFYSNLDEVKAGLAGVYKGMQAPLLDEWALTEVRSDNTKQGQANSSSPTNQSLNQLDMFTTTSYETRVYDYWRNSYANIRNANIIIQKLGATYDAGAGVVSLSPVAIPITDADRKQLLGEALIIRAYHYFNLVRLYGGVFLVHTPLSPDDAKLMDRASVADTYKLIQADLKTAADIMNTVKFPQIQVTERGRATGWTAKALLGKVYLTLNKKTDALTVLNDVRNNSGYALVIAAGTPANAYSNVFNTGNEVNEEILFTVRYKAGGVGLGNTFMNLFAPLNSGVAVVPGSGFGLNHPTADLDSSLRPTDRRRAVSIAYYTVSTTNVPYTRKYISTTGTVLSSDGESDWPVLRFADVLLMIAEAEGNTANSLSLINQVRTRAGIANVLPAAVASIQQFEDTLQKERRLEFAFENQRWFDLLRFNTTMQTVTIEAVLKAHFAREHPVHYVQYPVPAPTIGQLQARVEQRWFLLPIPQREIDTNPRLQSQQNSGY